MIPDEGLLNYIIKRTDGCRHITLIDPGKQSAEIAVRRAITAIEAGSRMIFIGGSTNTPNEIVHTTCLKIQEELELRIFAASQDPTINEEYWKIPIILFPGGSHALSPSADGITFMMLMNSKARKFLINEQLKGASYLEKYNIETIPTGYLVFAPGGKVGEVGEASLIEENELELVYSYALTAKMFGFKTLYLEAGSGSNKQVNINCIKEAKKVDELCLIVGGGIRTPEQAKLAAEAGADWIVTGNLCEELEDLDKLRKTLEELITPLNN
ncbi:MAG: phosphoglycerol geranylgeranyltransferase [Candidatus Poseidoniaceae archaeon]|jgi:phosphoglycerol geranylgeranyltransferase|nr:phosphoglycerol geranylgeranyltransferase [Candidatus Poseidoniaceae archaeon]